MELCIDTSTRYAGVALTQNARAIKVAYWHSNASHTLELSSTVVQMLGAQKQSINDIETIIVSKGPGGFSALRVGMGFAKGLSESLGIPLIGISTLEIEAARYFDTVQEPLCPLLEVGQNRIAWSLYQRTDDGWSLSLPEQITALDAMVNAVPTGTVFCGEGAWNTISELNELVRDETKIHADPPPTRLLHILASLGLTVLSSEGGSDSTAIEPNYLRSPSITMPSRTKQNEQQVFIRKQNRRYTRGRRPNNTGVDQA